MLKVQEWGVFEVSVAIFLKEMVMSHINIPIVIRFINSYKKTNFFTKYKQSSNMCSS